MTYYLLNREKLLKEAKSRYHDDGSKNSAAKYYRKNEDIFRENWRNQYRVWSVKEGSKRVYGIDRYRNMTDDESNTLKV